MPILLAFNVRRSCRTVPERAVPVCLPCVLEAVQPVKTDRRRGGSSSITRQEIEQDLRHRKRTGKRRSNVHSIARRRRTRETRDASQPTNHPLHTHLQERVVQDGRPVRCHVSLRALSQHPLNPWNRIAHCRRNVN